MENAKFYNKEDDFGNFGEIGMVKSYEIGYYTIDRLELDAKENDMSIKDFLKFWWNEISAECPFTWQRLGGGYGYNGTTLLVIGNVRFKDIYGQIMIDEYSPKGRLFGDDEVSYALERIDVDELCRERYVTIGNDAEIHLYIGNAGYTAVFIQNIKVESGDIHAMENGRATVMGTGEMYEDVLFAAQRALENAVIV